MVSTNTIMQQAISDNFSIIHLESKHVAHYDALPLHDAHKDPFDRIIIATAMSENLPIITADEKFNGYSDFVQIVW